MATQRDEHGFVPAYHGIYADPYQRIQFLTDERERIEKNIEYHQRQLDEARAHIERLGEVINDIDQQLYDLHLTYDNE